MAHPTGVSIFGEAYAQLYRNDLHAPGSVDRVLFDRMVRVTAESRSDLYDHSSDRPHYVHGSRPELERFISEVSPRGADVESMIDALAQRMAHWVRATPDRTLDEELFGGTEEQILARGSDWCTDVARLFCTLAQVAGWPARIVVLARPHIPYSGHEVTEVHRAGIWGCVDPLHGIVFRDVQARPVPAAALSDEPRLAAQQGPYRSGPGGEQFQAVAIADYPLDQRDGFDYTTASVNDYYRSILENARTHWPGGLRWLHGEASCS